MGVGLAGWLFIVKLAPIQRQQHFTYMRVGAILQICGEMMIRNMRKHPRHTPTSVFVERRNVA